MSACVSRALRRAQKLVKTCTAMSCRTDAGRHRLFVQPRCGRGALDWWRYVYEVDTDAISCGKGQPTCVVQDEMMMMMMMMMMLMMLMMVMMMFHGDGGFRWNTAT
eukprot:4889987-Amphidinium_carterae.3